MERVPDTAQKLNLLVAYPYITPEIIALIQEGQQDIRFLVDSGAFTAWKAGKPVQLDDYCRFIETLPVTPWRYFTLDVIGDPHGTMHNYETMLARGFNPVPIFTRGEDISVLEDYYKTSEVVGIGGLVGTQGNKGFVNGIMEKVADRKVHWLGFTRADFIRHYRPYMCDASSWESGARYGTAQIYMGRGNFAKVSRTEFAQRPDSKILSRIKQLGVEADEMRFEQSWRGGDSLCRRLCATSGVAYSLDVQKNLGTLMFCAAAASLGARLLYDGFHALRERNLL